MQARVKIGEMEAFTFSNGMGQKRDNKGTPAMNVRAGEEPNGKYAIARPNINLLSKRSALKRAP